MKSRASLVRLDHQQHPRHIVVGARPGRSTAITTGRRASSVAPISLAGRPARASAWRNESAIFGTASSRHALSGGKNGGGCVAAPPPTGVFGTCTGAPPRTRRGSMMRAMCRRLGCRHRGVFPRPSRGPWLRARASRQQRVDGRIVLSAARWSASRPSFRWLR